MSTTSASNRGSASPFTGPQSRWSEQEAAKLSPRDLLLYRSNLLGSDLTITNFGGGNTSAKLAELDPLTGETVQVLWVKGSGGDIGSMGLDGFATLYLNKLRALERLYRGVEHEDDMVAYLPHCTFNLNARAASIDTPLHALLSHPHIDHVHPDAVIALAASDAGEHATAEIYEGQVGWLPWRRPGFQLGVELRGYVEQRPHLRGVMLAGHGLICWGDSARACYENTIDIIARAARHLNKALARRPAFGGERTSALPADERARRASALMPRLRAQMGGRKPGHFRDDPETLEFVCSDDLARLAAIGTSCPDHFLRTKIAPLVLDPDQTEDEGYLARELDAYRLAYGAYYARNAKPGDPAMRDLNPVVVLVPRVGSLTFAADKPTARIAGEFYANAINVMRGAEAIGNYVGLPESEAYAIEYWALEEAKLRRMPKPRPLVGKIALVTGAGGGIGGAVAARLLDEGACVMLLDRDGEALEAVRAALTARAGKDRVAGALCDVTSEEQVETTFAETCRAFGGLDILVCNAGLASSASIEETTVALWRKNYEVLAEGYFLSARAAFPLLKRSGGAIVFVGSKNALAATPNASAYASAKAASLHLARCLALEGAPHGIRVNVVNPDAVIKGSKIWDGDWRKERAAAHGIDSGQALEDHYRQRSLLKLDVLPDDIAEAVLFFASEASAKSTGNVLNVDAGNAQAFVR